MALWRGWYFDKRPELTTLYLSIRLLPLSSQWCNIRYNLYWYTHWGQVAPNGVGENGSSLINRKPEIMPILGTNFSDINIKNEDFHCREYTGKCHSQNIVNSFMSQCILNHRYIETFSSVAQRDGAAERNHEIFLPGAEALYGFYLIQLSYIPICHPSNLICFSNVQQTRRFVFVPFYFLLHQKED